MSRRLIHHLTVLGRCCGLVLRMAIGPGISATTFNGFILLGIKRE